MKNQHFRIHQLLIVLALAVVATPARATLLSDLVGTSQSITIGDLSFNGFNYTQVGDMPAANAIDVETFTAADGSLGLTFVSTFLDLPGGSGSSALISYHVATTTPSDFITGARLAGNPVVSGGTGIASSTETFLPQDTTDSLNIFNISPGSSSNFASINFASGFAGLTVQNSLLAVSGGGVPNFGFISPTFTTTSTPIPEPSTVVLLGLGLGTLGLRWLRRK